LAEPKLFLSLYSQNNQNMKLALKFILLLLHLIISGVVMYYITDYISQPVSLGFVIAGGLVYLGIMITISLHTYQFLSSIKNQI